MAAKGQLSPNSLDTAFATLEVLAADGRRCPKTSGPDAVSGLSSAQISRLANDGRIAVEISSRNWRRITILQGAHAGKSTQGNPDPNARVYQTIDKSGTRVNGKLTNDGVSTRRQPSAPRFLTAEELKR